MNLRHQTLQLSKCQANTARLSIAPTGSSPAASAGSTRLSSCCPPPHPLQLAKSRRRCSFTAKQWICRRHPELITMLCCTTSTGHSRRTKPLAHQSMSRREQLPRASSMMLSQQGASSLRSRCRDLQPPGGRHRTSHALRNENPTPQRHDDAIHDSLIHGTHVCP